ncbi:MAG: carboxylating nicotinate-nucleotide diphosphorylase [Verrucomicrobiota bacterium]
MSSCHSSSAVDQAIRIALAEDIGSGDLTCQYFVDPGQTGHARILAKQTGVTAGVRLAAEVFQRVDPALRVEIVRPCGTRVEPGDVVLEIAGSVASILTAERVALNFLQQLSGVATLTRRFVDAVAAAPGARAKILDTRKTTPGLRMLEKAAVKAGGGTNHRFGLFDMVLVKDNHLAARDDLAFLQAAITRLQAEHPEIRVELEADTVEQVRGFLTLQGVAVILLDNMTPAAMRECVEMGGGRVQFEASGGVNLQTVAEIAATGVDFISVGALTHSAPAIDFSLDLQRKA